MTTPMNNQESVPVGNQIKEEKALGAQPAHAVSVVDELSATAGVALSVTLPSQEIVKPAEPMKKPGKAGGAGTTNPPRVGGSGGSRTPGSGGGKKKPTSHHLKFEEQTAKQIAGALVYISTMTDGLSAEPGQVIGKALSVADDALSSYLMGYRGNRNPEQQARQEEAKKFLALLEKHAPSDFNEKLFFSEEAANKLNVVTDEANKAMGAGWTKVAFFRELWEECACLVIKQWMTNLGASIAKKLSEEKDEASG